MDNKNKNLPSDLLIEQLFQRWEAINVNIKDFTKLSFYKMKVKLEREIYDGFYDEFDGYCKLKLDDVRAGKHSNDSAFEKIILNPRDSYLKLFEFWMERCDGEAVIKHAVKVINLLNNVEEFKHNITVSIPKFEEIERIVRLYSNKGQ